ncbi:MAG: hypothetical protein IJJ33_17265 [Victivallales bacterium]|nr:hypothetical protein [Victivallales bacterium]
MGLGKADPLVATEVPYLLANRFTANGKTIWIILNTGRNTYQGPLLRLHSAGKRYEELLHGRELMLAPDSVAAVIRPNEVLVLRETSKQP